MSPRHTAAAVLALLCGALLLAGCQPVGASKPVASSTTVKPTGTSTASTGTPPAGATPTTTPTGPPTPGATSTATRPSTSTIVVATGPGRACRIGVTTGQGEAGAGSRFTPIIFTNLADTPCQLTGDARLEYVAADGKTRIGNGFTIPGGNGTLEPGASITTTMRVTDTSNFEETRCKPEPATGLRVWPPADADPTVLPSPNSTACADGGPLDASPLPNPGLKGEGP